MPISGFKPDEIVLTPGGHRATVKHVKRNGAEIVFVRYHHRNQGRWFRAAALRKAAV